MKQEDLDEVYLRLYRQPLGYEEGIDTVIYRNALKDFRKELLKILK